MTQRSTHTTRPPTEAEAVNIILSCITRDERVGQLAFMRRKQGDWFADRVAKKVKAAWVKK